MNQRKQIWIGFVVAALCLAWILSKRPASPPMIKPERPGNSHPSPEISKPIPEPTPPATTSMPSPMVPDNSPFDVLPAMSGPPSTVSHWPMDPHPISAEELIEFSPWKGFAADGRDTSLGDQSGGRPPSATGPFDSEFSQ